MNLNNNLVYWSSHFGGGPGSLHILLKWTQAHYHLNAWLLWVVFVVADNEPELIMAVDNELESFVYDPTLTRMSGLSSGSIYLLGHGVWLS